jgi:hypothetical protein
MPHDAVLHADLHAFSMFRLDVFFLFLTWETVVYLRRAIPCCMRFQCADLMSVLMSIFYLHCVKFLL